MVPRADQPDLRSCGACHHPAFFERVMIWVRVIVCLDVPGRVPDSLEVGRGWSFEKCCEKLGPGREYLPYFDETANYVVHREMGEKRKRDCVVECPVKPAEFELIVYEEIGSPFGKPFSFDLYESGLYKRSIDVQPKVVSGLKVAYAGNPAPQAPAPDIKEKVIVHQTMSL